MDGGASGCRRVTFMVFAVATAVLFCLDIAWGSTDIPIIDVLSAFAGSDVDPLVRTIVMDIRLLKALTAVVAGIGLSVSGLQMQTLFRNPLAGPYVLGISSGASLGVALFILGMPGVAMSAGYSFGIAGAAWIGSGAVLALVGALSLRIRNIMVILILGMMFSSGVAALVQIMQYLSDNDSLKAYVVWTMGSLGDVTFNKMCWLLPAVSVGMIIAVLTIKPLNLLLLGEEYASTMGLDYVKSRNMLFLSTILLTGSVTAFCGPIGFVGLAVPHICRAIFNTSDHRTLIPACVLVGASSMLFCDIIATCFLLPVNAITSLLGIPVIVWIVLKTK